MTYFKENFIENLAKATDLLNEYWAIECNNFSPYQDEDEYKTMMEESLAEMNERYADQNLTFRIDTTPTPRDFIIAEKRNLAIRVSFSLITK